MMVSIQGQGVAEDVTLLGKDTEKEAQEKADTAEEQAVKEAKLTVQQAQYNVRVAEQKSVEDVTQAKQQAAEMLEAARGEMRNLEEQIEVAKQEEAVTENRLLEAQDKAKSEEQIFIDAAEENKNNAESKSLLLKARAEREGGRIVSDAKQAGVQDKILLDSTNIDYETAKRAEAEVEARVTSSEKLASNTQSFGVQITQNTEKVANADIAAVDHEAAVLVRQGSAIASTIREQANDNAEESSIQLNRMKKEYQDGAAVMQSELSATEAEEVERHQAEMKRAANFVSTVNSFVHPLQDAIAVSGEKKKEKINVLSTSEVSKAKANVETQIQGFISTNEETRLKQLDRTKKALADAIKVKNGALDEAKVIADEAKTEAENVDKQIKTATDEFNEKRRTYLVSHDIAIQQLQVAFEDQKAKIEKEALEAKIEQQDAAKKKAVAEAAHRETVARDKNTIAQQKLTDATPEGNAIVQEGHTTAEVTLADMRTKNATSIAKAAKTINDAEAEKESRVKAARAREIVINTEGEENIVKMNAQALATRNAYNEAATGRIATLEAQTHQFTTDLLSKANADAKQLYAEAKRMTKETELYEENSLRNAKNAATTLVNSTQATADQQVFNAHTSATDHVAQVRADTLSEAAAHAKRVLERAEGTLANEGQAHDDAVRLAFEAKTEIVDSTPSSRTD